MAVREVVFHKSLPPDCSSDWHQIIAKALYKKYMAEITGGPFNSPITLTRAEIEAASDAEFEYGWDGESLTFRPVRD